MASTAHDIAMESDPFLFHVLLLAVTLGVAGVAERFRPDAFPVDRSWLQRWVLAIGLWSITVVATFWLMPALPGGPEVLRNAPIAVQFVVLLLALDGLQAVIHWNLHRWPALWRFHAVHHADTRFDTATALRFHPAENLLRAFADTIVLWVLAPDPLAVGGVLAVTAVWNVFQHARIALPRALQGPMELLLVTPDVHRIHHALPAHLHDRNFGTVFTVWDRLFGWYRAPDGQPFDTGVSGWRAEDDLVANLLAPLQPLADGPEELDRPADGDRRAP